MPTSACLTCSYNESGDGQTFCAEALRRGAIGYVGATDTSSDNSRPTINFLSRVAKGQSLGAAMRDALNIGGVDSVQLFSPFQMLVGDPTFELGLNGSSEQDLLETSVGELRAEGSGYVLPVTVTLDPTDTTSYTGLSVSSDRSTDLVLAPYYGGDSTFRCHVMSVHEYPQPPGTDRTSALPQIVVRFDNPAGLGFSGVGSAVRVVGASDPVNVANEINSQVTLFAATHANGVTSVNVPLPLGGSDFINQSSTALPGASFELELLFE
jgi:hypothetical protein